ncbi:MAG: flagellar protein F [Thermoplasmataceae archaeon]
MGFSYVAAVAILLSSSLIFFGIVYGEFMQNNTQLGSAQNTQTQQEYNLLNSKVNITGYYVESGSAYNVTINMTNTGSVPLDLNTTTLLVNGTISSFTSPTVYLFPLGNSSITFHVSTARLMPVEIIFNTGYQKFMEVIS